MTFFPAAIAVTTDDGWEAPGYAALLSELARCGHALSSAAPSLAWSSNGTGTGSPPELPLKAVTRSLPRHKRVAGIPVTVMECPPAAVTRHLLNSAAMTTPPKALVAGVNHGPNVGSDLIHSGTFGCALTAAWNGVPALAVSLDDVYSVDETAPGPLRFDLAARAATLALDWLLGRKAPLLINLNIPNSVVPGRTHFVATSPRPDDTGKGPSDRQALTLGQASLSVFAGCDLRGDTAQGLALAQYLDDNFAAMR